jgi:GNAT superfamily N-acetyltransferase
MFIKQIQLIEELAANAWPAAVVQVVDGWRLRYNAGVTQRANSVWPNAHEGHMSLSALIEEAEAFYTRHGARTLFQMCPASLPAELDAALAERGYAALSHTHVQIAALENVLARTAVCPADARVDVQVGVLDDEWMNTYAAGTHNGAHEQAMRRGIIERIGPHTACVLAHLDGQPAAVGLGVLERGWVGVFCMETLPAFRRRGAARAILHALAAWGRSADATQMYLQVMTVNAPANAAYAQAGFETLYTYHYRQAAVKKDRD